MSPKILRSFSVAALLSALLELPKEDLATVQKWMTAGAASSMFRRIVLQGRMQVQQARPRPANVFLLHGVSGLLEVLPNIFRARLEIFSNQSTTTTSFLLLSSNIVYVLPIWSGGLLRHGFSDR